MAGYKLVIKPTAAKELDAIEPKKLRQRLVGSIEGLAGDPRPAGCEKLAGSPNLYRIRQGDYRAVCAVEDRHAVVRVLKVGHRREVYR